MQLHTSVDVVFPPKEQELTIETMDCGKTSPSIRYIICFASAWASNHQNHIAKSMIDELHLWLMTTLITIQQIFLILPPFPKIKALQNLKCHNTWVKKNTLFVTKLWTTQRKTEHSQSKYSSYQTLKTLILPSKQYIHSSKTSTNQVYLKRPTRKWKGVEQKENVTVDKQTLINKNRSLILSNPPWLRT